jgi:protein phosphatase slingshot
MATSSTSNQQIVLSCLHGSLSLPKIATTTTNTIDHHLARIVTGNAENLRAHLDSMYKLLRPDDRLTLMVQLESGFPNRFRYLVIVTCVGRQETEESAVLGFDVDTNEITIGMTLPIWADLDISLDGDGGFKLTSCDRCHIFKPVSVQALWTAYQSLHKASNQARHYNYIVNNGLTHSWIEYYRNPDIRSNQIYVNEWHQMDDILSHRSDSPHLYQPYVMKRFYF